jgi:PEP-CTERM motif
MKPMTNIPRLITSGAHASLIMSLLALLPSAANAAVIYTEGFDNAATSSVSTFGWTAFRNNGTNLSTSTVDPLVVGAAASQVTISSGNANIGLRTALISNAGTIALADYETDLKIRFTQSATDAVSAEPAGGLGWRVLAQVGSTIYASNFIAFSATAVTSEVLVSGSVWNVWTGETNLTNGFDIANISTSPGTISGSISNIGILAIDGSSGNDRLRLSDFSIEGTAVVPEPSAALLGGLGMLALLRRRRA